MPRTQSATANRRYRCGVMVPSKYQKNEDGTPVLEPCAKSKSAHQPSTVKKKKTGQMVTHPPKVQDHEYGDPYEVHIQCGNCKENIQPGDRYRFWTPKFGAKVIRCKACPSPSRSFFTRSEILSMAWGIADQDVPNFESVEDFEEWKDEVATQIEEIVEVIQEKLDNIEQGFGHTSLPVYEELEERRDMYEQWKDEVESWDVDVEDSCSNCEMDKDDHDACDGYQEPELVCAQCGEDSKAPSHDWNDDENFDHDYEDATDCETCGRAEDEHACDEYTVDLDALQDAAQEILGNCPE